MMDDNVSETPVRSPGIPDGSMLVGEVVITSYFNEHGAMMYCVHTEGNMNLAQALGLCELAKISVYNDYMKGVEVERDDEDGE